MSLKRWLKNKKSQMVLKISFRSDFSDCSGSAAFYRRVTSVPASEFTWITWISEDKLSFGKSEDAERKNAWHFLTVKAVVLKLLPYLQFHVPLYQHGYPWSRQLWLVGFCCPSLFFSTPPPCCSLEKRDLHEWKSPTCLLLTSAYWGHAACCRRPDFKCW